MYSQNKTIQHLLSLLKAFDINRIVISPGSRHFPLTHSLEADNFFELYSVVDERSAAFFALGIIQRTNDPVAVCCTSGSAVTNYGSAVSEAYYQHLPLLLITVDRIPELLSQKEDQMIRQDNLFHEFIKYHGNLPMIRTETDEWYANRIINEALIELHRYGKGPVQINFPVFEHNTDTFEVKVLPKVRKISYNNFETSSAIWMEAVQKLLNKKVIIVWGQSVEITDNLRKSATRFCEIFDAVILTDYISNCTCSNTIKNTLPLLPALSISERKSLRPDIVITIGGNVVFNGEIKGFIKSEGNDIENWQVGPNGDVCDPFRHLTEIFEMNENSFFQRIIAAYDDIDVNKATPRTDYFDNWHQVSISIVEPDVEFSQLQVIGKLIKSLPKNSILQLSNSNTIRMGHLFNLDKTIRCFANRGVNGIDGCMSTAVGYASNSKDLVFLIIGDLTFFYDMNALWNRHLSDKLRILLVNNEGGAVMHMPFNPEIGKILPNHTSAGHTTSAKGWVESIGVNYISASNEKEMEQGIEKLVSPTIQGPILLEVFTKKEIDVQIFKQYYSSINRITSSELTKQRIKLLIEHPELTKQSIKRVIKKITG